MVKLGHLFKNKSLPILDKYNIILNRLWAFDLPNGNTSRYRIRP